MTTATAANEIAASRTFDAPRRLVFSMWTTPTHLSWWYGPHGFKTETTSFDFRPGGEWIFTMRGPAGKEYPNHVVYREIDAPNRIVYTHVDPKFESTVTFEDEGGKTRVSVVMRFDDAATREFVAREHGALAGLQQTLERLGRLAESFSAWAPAGDEVVMSREFDAPRELVYAMWTQPEHIAWWYGPRGYSMTIESMDVRPGGSWKFVLHGPDGGNLDFDITYQVVEPPSRLAYSVPSEHFDVEHTFEDLGGKRTRLVSRARFETPAQRDAMLARGAIEGYDETLTRLKTIVETHVAWTVPEEEIVTTRLFDAPRELVFRANTDPKMMMKWWGPHHTKNHSVDIDLRVGGGWHVVQEAFGRVHDFSGEYLDVRAPDHLRFTFVWGGAPDQVMSVEATYEDKGGKTLVTSRTRFSTRKQRDDMLSKGAIGGMMQSNERLDALLDELQ